MTLETMTTNRFATSSLVGKFINISDEEESKYMRSDKFKALVSGDTMTAERKFGGTFEFNPQAKMVFATNEMPTFDGVNYGIRRRVFIIPFRRTITLEERDPFISERFIPSELQGIMRWAMEGLVRLRRNGYRFSTSVTATTALESFEEESSTVVGFIKEAYTLEGSSETTPIITNNDIYDGYKNWCVRNGKKNVASLRFFKDANRMFPKLRDLAVKTRMDGKFVRGYHLIDVVDVDAQLSVDDLKF